MTDADQVVDRYVGILRRVEVITIASPSWMKSLLSSGVGTSTQWAVRYLMKSALYGAGWRGGA